MSRRPRLASAIVLLVAVAFLFALPWFFVEETKPEFEVLLEQMKDPDQATWNDAVRLAARRGHAHIPRLIEALEDDHRAVREGAAHVLGDLGPVAKDAVPALIKRIREDDDDFVRWKAVRALGYIGPDAEDALPLLREVAETETELLEASAKAAIERIGRRR